MFEARYRSRWCFECFSNLARMVEEQQRVLKWAQRSPKPRLLSTLPDENNHSGPRHELRAGWRLAERILEDSWFYS